MDQDSGYLELVKDLTATMEPKVDGKSSPTSVSDLSSTASAASMDSPSSSSMTSISLSTPPPAQSYNRRRADDLCETLQKHLFIQSVIPEERPNTLALRSSQSSLSSDSLSHSVAPVQHPEHGHLAKLSQNLKEIDDFISVTEEIMKRDRERDEELYAREKQRKHRQSSGSSRPNSMRKSSTLRRKFSMIERTTKRESADGLEHTKLRQTRSTEGTSVAAPPPPPIINSSYTNPAQFLGLQSRLNFHNGRVECVDPELREKNCIQKTHELVRHIIQQERITPLVQPEHVDRVLLRNFFRRGSVAVTTEDFEMTNVCISEDQQEIGEGTGPPIEEPTVNLKELEPALCDREPVVMTDIEAPPPPPLPNVGANGTSSIEMNDVEM